jgi:hypothetical protein
MIFGGYGRKTKVRGEVFFPCMRCEALNVFGLVENYGYGQLYGIRLAKFKTERGMVCSHCQDGLGLEKSQWDQALLIAQSLKARGYELSLQEMAESAVELARKAFPEAAEEVRAMLAEPLGEGTATVEELEPAGELESGESKTCPDCAEPVKVAARKCRFCGYQFESDGLADTRAVEPSMP